MPMEALVGLCGMFMFAKGRGHEVWKVCVCVLGESEEKIPQVGH